jgi:cytochrome c553
MQSRPSHLILPLVRTLATLLTLGFMAGVAQAELTPRAQEIIDTRCALCHGRAGESASAIYPRLAAQDRDYMIKQLKDFRDGRRKGETMTEMAEGLTNEEITELAGWFSSRTPGIRRSSDSDLAAVGKYIFTKGNPYSGVAACSSCHGEQGHGTQALPRLAGQHPGYLEIQLKEFGNRARTNDNTIMHSIASKLTELEIHAVATYIAGLQ